MKWSIIYEVNGTHGARLGHVLPKQCGKWIRTEYNDQYAYDYLADEGLEIYRNGKHAKWIACISDMNFKKFLDNILLPIEVEDTAGMIGGMGSDGMNLGWMPAWCLRAECFGDNIFDQWAYVCPEPEDANEKIWLRGMNESELKSWIKEYI